MDPQLLAQQAIERHRRGDAKGAEHLCLQILALAPADFTANYLLGAIRFGQGRSDDALPLFEKAVGANPAATGPFVFLGLLLQGQGRLAEALSSFDRVLAADRNNIEALVNRGNVLDALGRHAEAVVSYDRALSLKPDFVPAFYNRGNALRALGRLLEALASFESALAIQGDYVDAWVNRGSTLRDLGQLQAALASFERALVLQPGNGPALYNRGTALNDLGQFAEALACFDRAIQVMPGSAAALANRAVVLKNLGRLEEALADCDRALLLEPGSADLHNNRSNLLGAMKRPADALASIEQALAIAPANMDALNNRGTLLRDMKRLDEALACFNQALGLAPGKPLLLCNRGLVLRDMNCHAEALADFDAALLAAPGEARALYNRGLALQSLGRLPEALDSHDRALGAEPQFSDALLGRAEVLRDLGRFAEALQSYDRALSLAPDNAAALSDMGWLLQKMNRPEEALASYDKALAIDPDFAQALHNRGTLLWLKFRRFGEGRRDLEQLARMDPDYDYLRGDLVHLKMQAGDWQDLDAEIAAIDAGVRAGKRAVRPFVYQAIAQSPADLQAASVIYARHRFPAMPAPAIHNSRGSRDKIRLGYVCGEFREHATSFLAAGLFERHDKAKFELVAFDTGWNDASPMRKRLEAAFDKFIALASLPDDAAAEKVRAEEIDILVNLTGYFGSEPMGIFARRPAPVQVNYLGFPATLGADYIDYILADPIVIPPGDQQFYTEKVVYLPESYQVNDLKRAVADAAPSRTDCGLPQNAFVFCNFNNVYKFTPGMFAVWMEILRQTPDSVLWLLESNREFPRQFRQQAERQGIAPDRLIFAPPAPHAEFLARMTLADLFLDCLPYNAHTTASDALWAGVPLLTCRGPTFPGRVGASLLHACGLPELVTESLEDYQAMALRLAGNPDLISSLRRKLAGNRNTAALFDTDRFRRNIESAYLAMWEGFQRGKGPHSYCVEPTP